METIRIDGPGFTRRMLGDSFSDRTIPGGKPAGIPAHWGLAQIGAVFYEENRRIERRSKRIAQAIEDLMDCDKSKRRDRIKDLADAIAVVTMP